MSANMPAVEQVSLSTTAAAKALGVSAHTLRNWRRDGKGPAYIRVSRSQVLYLFEDVQAWLADRRVSTSDSQRIEKAVA